MRRVGQGLTDGAVGGIIESWYTHNAWPRCEASLPDPSIGPRVRGSGPVLDVSWLTRCGDARGRRGHRRSESECAYHASVFNLTITIQVDISTGQCHEQTKLSSSELYGIMSPKSRAAQSRAKGPFPCQTLPNTVVIKSSRPAPGYYYFLPTSTSQPPLSDLNTIVLPPLPFFASTRFIPGLSSCRMSFKSLPSTCSVPDTLSPSM